MLEKAMISILIIFAFALCIYIAFHFLRVKELDKLANEKRKLEREIRTIRQGIYEANRRLELVKDPSIITFQSKKDEQEEEEANSFYQ